MRGRGPRRPARVGRNAPPAQAQGPALSRDFRQGMALYQQFNRFFPSRAMRISHPRVIPPVVVELGELAGLMYRSEKGQPGRPRTYIHLMRDPPRLVSNVEGTQLYIVGGSYRVTRHGIEG